MKKPIDPNLNDIFDIDALNEDEPIKAENDAPLTSSGMTLNEKDPEPYHHHHHHHSSSSSSSSSSHHLSKHHKHHSSSSQKKNKKKMSIAGKIAIVFLIILLILIIAIVGTIFVLEKRGKSNLTNVTENTNYEEIIEYNGHKYMYNSDVISIAFIGVDKRELDENATIGTAGQADADLVLTVNTKTGRAKVIAVPRDTMVDVDLYSESDIFLRTENMQLCLSYAYGNGTNTSAENVTTSLSRILYNVPINKYFALDLDGIEPINDAIGGVTVESLYDFENLGISKGDTVLLTGDLTEAYVRQRDMDSVDASLNRTARQVQYIKAFANQLLPAVANDFSVVSNLYNTASSYSTTNMDVSNVTYLASFLLSKGVSDFETVTLDGEMKESTSDEYSDYVYAEFYPNETSTLETVLDTFYTQID